MRQFLLAASFLLLVCGCGTKAPPPAATEKNTPADVTPADTTAADRTKLLKSMKGLNSKARGDAMEELAGWVDTDPESVAALLELLKDRTTTGAGKVLPTQINSTREAAATTLLWGGAKGEAALKDKGFAILREGLNDRDPVIREHTAYTIGKLGAVARPLSPDVMKLCNSSDANVRAAAFEALTSIGIVDVPAFVALINHEDREVGRLAAQQVASLSDIPAAAIPLLIVALGSDDASIRLGAAAGIVTAGPQAGAAAKALAEAIVKSYPPEHNPMRPYEPGSEMVYWLALSKIGADAVGPTTDLLVHKNLFVRALAARTLGVIGPTAKSAAGKLKSALSDPSANVIIEAACALCLIGESKDEALAMMKRAIDAPAPSDIPILAIAAVPRMGESGKSLLPLALGKLTSENPNARFAAVGLVGTLPPEEATKYAADVGKLALDRFPPIKQRAGIVLEKLGKAAAPAGPALSQALQAETDEQLRDQFIDALTAMGPGAKPALPTLLPLVRDSSLNAYKRMRVILAVASADPSSKDVLDALLAAAADRDPVIRATAATALGKLDPLPPSALTKLTAMARRDSSTSTMLSAVRALAQAGPRAKPARGDLEAIAADTQVGLALWAKVGLAAIDGDIAKSAPAVRSALTDRRFPARTAGVEALFLIGPTMSDLPALVKLLRDIESRTREFAARCIGAIGPQAKEAVPQLILLLNDREGEVRIAAANALGEMGPAGLPAVEKLKDLRRDSLAASAAGKALEKLGVVEKK